MSNPYALGTPECIAYAMGEEYGSGVEVCDPAPLSGEWAGDLLPHDVIASVWREIMGPSWDTYADGTDDDREEDGAILDAWEEGYFTVVNGED